MDDKYQLKTALLVFKDVLSGMDEVDQSKINNMVTQLEQVGQDEDPDYVYLAACLYYFKLALKHA